MEYKCTILFFIINSKETSRKIFSNNYVPCYQDLNTLPWFERDDFSSNINGLKCEQFMENPDEHFNNAEVGNFDIIHNRCKDNPLENTVQNYKTVKVDDFKNYPREKKKAKKKSFLLQ